MSDSPGLSEAKATRGEAPPLEPDTNRRGTKRVTFGGTYLKVSSAEESSEEEIRYGSSSGEEGSLAFEGWWKGGRLRTGRWRSSLSAAGGPGLMQY